MILGFKIKNIIIAVIIICIACVGIVTIYEGIDENSHFTSTTVEKKYIKWVEFNVPYIALDKALKIDIESQDEDIKINWIEILAYLGAKNGGDFSKYKNNQMDSVVNKLKSGETTIEELTENMKYYDYYYEAYNAILGGMVGEYEIEVPSENNPEEKVWKSKYGLKAFSPIAKGYYYSHYDDFGSSRSYGFKRKHLGNDLMGQVGTPVIAVESGYIEALGWNQYGGWRIGIRSFDKKRYYYYAHLRKNFPFNKELEIGSVVQAGDVIGYLGRTGYSTTENTNNINEPHLHFGMQLIFDECQKDCNSEIWIDVYNIVKLLYRNKSETVKNLETKEYHRIYNIKDPAVDNYEPLPFIPNL